MEIVKHNVKLEEREYLRVFFFGDSHIDHINCDQEALKKAVSFVKKISDTEQVLVVTMGDLNDFITNALDPRFDSLAFPPDIALKDLKNLAMIECDHVVKFFDPIKHLIIATICGNHEAEFIKRHNFDVYKNYSERLGAERLGAIGWIAINVVTEGSTRGFTIVAAHGEKRCNGEPGAVVRKCKEMLGRFDTDVCVMGHHHRMEDSSDPINCLSTNRAFIYEKPRFFLTNGTFMKKHKIGSAGYAESHGGKNPDIGITEVRATMVRDRRKSSPTTSYQLKLSVHKHYF